MLDVVIVEAKRHPQSTPDAQAETGKWPSILDYDVGHVGGN